MLLARRRSVRAFNGRPVDHEELAYLVWCAYGQINSGELIRRTVPSAGGIFPLEVQVGAVNVTGLVPGWYRVADSGANDAGIVSNGWTRTGDLGDLNSCFLTKHVPFDRCGAVVLFSGSPASLLERYGERGYRFLLFEAGHAVQNALLAGTALGLACVPLGGFDDGTIVEELSWTDTDIWPLYAVVVGHAEEARHGR